MANIDIGGSGAGIFFRTGLGDCDPWLCVSLSLSLSLALCIDLSLVYHVHPGIAVTTRIQH